MEFMLRASSGGKCRWYESRKKLMRNTSGRSVCDEFLSKANETMTKLILCLPGAMLFVLTSCTTVQNEPPATTTTVHETTTAARPTTTTTQTTTTRSSGNY